MRRRLQVIFVLFSWLIATGVQWDVAQIVAWGRMLASYSHDMTMGAAVERTFSGEMCQMCRAVQKGRQEQDRNGPMAPGTKSPGKILDLYPPSMDARVIAPASVAQVFVSIDLRTSGEERACPPCPPPRASA